MLLSIQDNFERIRMPGIDLNALRASLAEQGGLDATDDTGNIMKGDEAVAYYRGQSAAGKAIKLLIKADVLDPPLEGLYEHDDIELRTAFQEIAEALHCDPQVVYNPGCGTNVTLATAFPDARAFFVDTDEEAIENVKKRFPDAQIGDMHTFQLPEDLKADITLIMNAGHMPQEELDKVVADNGLVLVNDWHSAGTFMRAECPNYRFVTGLQTTGHAVYSDPTQQNNDSNALFVFKRIDQKPSK